MAKTRMTIEFSTDVSDLLKSLAETEETTQVEIVRRALSVMKAYKDQKARGRYHLGFTTDPEHLDVQLIGILDR
jgi:hypothetical protein